jgi:glutamate synthase domain-containing protein 2
MAKALGLGALLAGGGTWLGRKALGGAFRFATRLVLTELYTDNLLEFASAATRSGPLTILENSLRAEKGEEINRPMGSRRHYPELELSNLMFHIAELNPLPTPTGVPINMKILLGPKANRPLEIDMPLMIGGMAYGLALTADVKIAIARATRWAGTATNTGEGAFLQAERDEAKHLIVQRSRSSWGREPEHLKKGDAIQIQLGQGAIAGVGHYTQAADIRPRLRHELGLMPNEDAIIHSRQMDMNSPADLKKIVKELKKLVDVPIDIKMGASKYLEQDMEVALDAGVDMITLDGSQAATAGAPPILQDDFGVPVGVVAARADDYLRKVKMRDQVSLVVGGGLYTPGDFLKILALGADAVYSGSMALFSMQHTQSLKALPWEPPTQLSWYVGSQREQFKIKPAALSLYRWLESCRLELEDGVRALGKDDVTKVNRQDMLSLNKAMAEICGLDYVGKPPQRNQ